MLVGSNMELLQRQVGSHQQVFRGVVHLHLMLFQVKEVKRSVSRHTQSTIRTRLFNTAAQILQPKLAWTTAVEATQIGSYLLLKSCFSFIIIYTRLEFEHILLFMNTGRAPLRQMGRWLCTLMIPQEHRLAKRIEHLISG